MSLTQASLVNWHAWPVNCNLPWYTFCFVHPVLFLFFFLLSLPKLYPIPLHDSFYSCYEFNVVLSSSPVYVHDAVISGYATYAFHVFSDFSSILQQSLLWPLCFFNLHCTFFLPLYFFLHTLPKDFLAQYRVHFLYFTLSSSVSSVTFGCIEPANSGSRILLRPCSNHIYR